MEITTKMKCPECDAEMFISEWEGWVWMCPFCDYIGREATYEESDKQQNDFAKYLKEKNHDRKM